MTARGAGAGAAPVAAAGDLEVVVAAPAGAVLAGPAVGVIVVVVVVVPERVVEVRVVVVVPPAISLLSFAKFSFDAVPPFAVAAVLLGALVPAFHHTRRRRALEGWERGRRRRVAVLDAPEPGKATLLWFADSDVRVVGVGSDVGVVVDLPQVNADAVPDTALPACRRSLGDLPRGGGTIHGARGERKPHHLGNGAWVGRPGPELNATGVGGVEEVGVDAL
jgi:hypothetical protein